MSPEIAPPTPPHPPGWLQPHRALNEPGTQHVLMACWLENRRGFPPCGSYCRLRCGVCRAFGLAAGLFIPKYHAGLAQARAPPRAASAGHAVLSAAGAAYTGPTFHGSPGPFSTCVTGDWDWTQLCSHRNHAHNDRLRAPRRVASPLWASVFPSIQ